MCEKCGAVANIHTSDFVGGTATVRHFCQDCFGDEKPPSAYSHRRGEAAIVAAVGLIVLLMSVAADYLRFGKEVGFGSHQQLGVIIGIILLILGAVARAGSIITIGASAVALSVVADWVGFGSSPGFGAQQLLGTVLGVGMLLSAFKLSRMRSK